MLSMAPLHLAPLYFLLFQEYIDLTQNSSLSLYTWLRFSCFRKMKTCLLFIFFKKNILLSKIFPTAKCDSTIKHVRSIHYHVTDVFVSASKNLSVIHSISLNHDDDDDDDDRNVGLGVRRLWRVFPV